MRSRHAYILLRILLGGSLSFFLAWISFINAIHGGFYVAAYLFPYTVLLSPDMSELSLTSLLLALILWPLYGAILGATIRRGGKKWQLIAIVLLILHVAVGSIAWKRVDSHPVKITYDKK